MANRSNKNLYEIIDYHIKSKRFIGGMGRLERDGSISKLNGQILARKRTQNGEEMVVIDNFLGKQRKGQKKRWQAVLIKNLIALNENHWRHTRVA